MTTYTVKSPLSISLWEGGGEVEIDAIISFRVNRLGGGLLVEVTRFQLSSIGMVFADCPNWLRARFENDASFNSWLLSEAEARDEYERDCKADYDRDERRLEL